MARRPHSDVVKATLGQIIHANHGIFSRAEALDCGETDFSLGEARRAGLVVRLRRGMYAPADVYAACDDSGKHLLHARAAVAAQRGEVALTGASAAALHGFALYQQDLSTVHIVRLDQGSSRRNARTNHHIVLRGIEPDLMHHDGLLTVGPARAVWEVACRSSLEAGVVTADSAVRRQPTLPAALAELQERFAYYPGSRTGRTAIRLADARSESPGESVTRVQFFRYGIPMPELQYWVVNGRGELVGIADFGWEEYRHLAEFDGKVKYQKLLRPGDSPSDCVFREKRREDRMRAESRGMSRFTWSMVMPDSARRSTSDLRRALDESRRLYARNRTVIAS